MELNKKKEKVLNLKRKISELEAKKQRLSTKYLPWPKLLLTILTTICVAAFTPSVIALSMNNIYMAISTFVFGSIFSISLAEICRKIYCFQIKHSEKFKKRTEIAREKIKIKYEKKIYKTKEKLAQLQQDKAIKKFDDTNDTPETFRDLPEENLLKKALIREENKPSIEDVDKNNINTTKKTTDELIIGEFGPFEKDEIYSLL